MSLTGILSEISYVSAGNYGKPYNKYGFIEIDNPNYMNDYGNDNDDIDCTSKGGYLSKIVWADDLPFSGRIEQNGLDYFRKKGIYIRSVLRNNQRFSLSEESEECLRRINAIECDDPYFVIDERVGSLAAVQDLENQGFIQSGKKGIIPFASGGFHGVVTVMPKGKTYFRDKNEFIEEILTFPQNNCTTSINISSGDYSPIQFGTVNSEQNIEYNFDLAQDALNEVLAKIDELGLQIDEKQELLENIEEAQKLVKEKKKGPLKTILKGIWDVLKDIGCSVASSLIISKLQ